MVVVVVVVVGVGVGWGGGGGVEHTIKIKIGCFFHNNLGPKRREACVSLSFCESDLINHHLFCGHLGNLTDPGSTHEGPSADMMRLFSDHIFTGADPKNK